MCKIVPAILAYTKEDFERQLNKALSVSSYIQIDIADGKFTESKTWNHPKEILKMVPDNIALEIHLMMKAPIKHLRPWVKSEKVKRIIFHYSSCLLHKKFIKICKKNEKEVFLALNPETRISKVEPLLEHIDGVQFMTVHPGKQGSPFLHGVMQKIEFFEEKYPRVYISADGGINEKNIHKLKEIGVRQFGIGSALMKGNTEKNFQKLEKALLH